ncbi:MAG: hypothetical protein LKI98_04630 [Bifidobacterium crudilactis]|nr:hypothetical protein [Bifidobacterium crudilactis]
MSKRHIISTGIMTLFIMLSAIAVFLYYIEVFAPEIAVATIILLIIGLATGALLPNVLSTWIILLLTVIGGAILLLGEVPITSPMKFILLAIFPVSAGIMSIGRFVLIKFGWISFNTQDIERYAQHYDQVTKLQTQYNAAKMYRKIIHFIHDDDDRDLWFTVTAIHWAHNTQFKQFHPVDYDQTLREISRVLKNDRLPSESLYYLGHGTFLIISHQLSEQTYAKRNELTKAHLRDLRCLESTPQFKWGSFELNASTVEAFPTPEAAYNYLRREMETDLVVEYMKGEDS